MKSRKKTPQSDNEVADLLRKLLVLQLFQLGVPQAVICKRAQLSINAVNALLKGIKRNG